MSNPVLGFLLAFVLCGLDNPTKKSLDLIQRATSAYDAKRYGEALQLVDSAIATGIESTDALKLRGFIVQAQEDRPAMIATGKQLARIAPSNVYGWYFQAVGHLFMQNYLDFIPAAKQCCSIDTAICHSTKLDEMLASLSQDPIGVQDSTFTTIDRQIRVPLPKSWTTREMDDGKTLNWFVSLEPLRTMKDAFSVGVTVRWIRGFIADFKQKEKLTPNDVVVAWRGYLTSLSKGSEMYHDSTLDSGRVVRGAWIGMGRVVERTVIEHMSPDLRYRLKMLDVTLSHNDDIITLTFECPEEQFSVWQPRFRKAFEAVQLPTAGTLKK
ncbi:MAG: hypothetical protein IPI24_13635 [Ignavibacteria bacterium]|nr:hypothetical protein [Ignavibacteria bacterium]MBK9183756.1 hypothetical protein [Ignavibacteria bacterium]